MRGISVTPKHRVDVERDALPPSFLTAPDGNPRVAPENSKARPFGRRIDCAPNVSPGDERTEPTRQRRGRGVRQSGDDAKDARRKRPNR
jgi:hypothetical protein